MYVCTYVCVYICMHWLHSTTFRMLVPQTRVEPKSTAVKVLSLNHWTARDVGIFHLLSNSAFLLPKAT